MLTRQLSITIYIYIYENCIDQLGYITFKYIIYFLIYNVVRKVMYVNIVLAVINLDIGIRFFGLNLQVMFHWDYGI